ncbi:MAG: response regulator [bacterium]
MNNRVLLIDDEQSFRRTCSVGLMQNGFETVPCENGISALKKLELFMQNNLPPVCAVVDIKLPDIDGVRLVKIIKFKYPDLPIILISAYADYLQSDEVKELEVNAILEKPFNIDELTEKFKNITEIPASTDEKTEKSVHSAYIMLKLQHTADVYDIYQKLYYHKNVLYCDATNGDYDIILLVQDKSADQCVKFFNNEIQTIPELEHAEICPVHNLILEESTISILNLADKAFTEDEYLSPKKFDKNKVSSYLFLKVEPEKIEDIYPSLKLNKHVIYCDYTSGYYNFVIYLEGTHYHKIDKIIEQEILTNPGILKAVEFPIINMMEM